ncbi:DcaP family trimeric outer membrane transporter [Aureibacter tunicatorum]|uniref:Porin n=1 Tax=Aureibacter tunicatorum TaxID=866807 RepID=A0AAE4BVF5_9BACT|nr:DcaP family trimeric outer membrane transporter [Aureibacter tunicatorum]MDR6241842.1 hypothetical protein [Aureibacter tunicatorum]BDD07089.1 hypothetical protein AUTU_45720 [Aureibacter tunicatorum]
MNSIFKNFLFVALLFCFCHYASAQEHVPLHQTKKQRSGVKDLVIHTEGSQKIDTTLVKDVFKKDIPKVFNAPGIPRFTIIGKEGKYYLGLGGYVKASLAYDFDGAINNPVDFIVSDITVPEISGQKQILQLSAITSNFFLNFVRYHGKHKYSAYLNGNFTGPNNSFQIQYAYVTFNNWSIGFNATLFSDVGASVPTVDFEGPNGFTFIRNTTLSYAKSFNSKWAMGISLEAPFSSATYSEHTKSSYQNVPEVPGYVQYSWDNKHSWIRITGLFKAIGYRDLVEETERHKIGWGIKASGKANLTKDKLTLYYQLVRGEGISTYIQDLYELGIDYVPNGNDPGKLETVKTWAGYAGIEYHITSKLFTSCTYSHARVFLPKGYSDDLQYGYGQYFVANIFMNIRPTVQVALEYVYGKRTDQDQASNHANRVQTMIQFNF